MNRTSKITVTASLQPDCSPTDDIRYSWELAGVDKDSGMLNMMLPVGKTKAPHNLSLSRLYLRPPAGLWYIRCIARSFHSISRLTYDFGFIETVPIYPLQCEITPSEGKAILDKFTVKCIKGYIGKTPTGYIVTLRSTIGPVAIPKWRSPFTIRLPTQNYSVRVKVEAKYLSLPSLFSHVVAKVCFPFV